MKSSIIKNALKEAQIPYWKVGNALNVSENTVWRTLRNAEVKEETAEKILSAIESIKGERDND